MGSARLRARSLGLILSLVGGTAQVQAAEVMHMPYACRFDGARVHLRPSEDRTYALIGGHEREIFTACSPTDPGTCRNWFVHRFDFDCDGARVAWIDAAAAAARHTDWDAWNARGHFRMRMNELWGVARARPLGPGRRWMRREMREEGFAVDGGHRGADIVTLPPGFAPAVGIPLTFSGGAPEVAEEPPSGAPAVAAYSTSEPQRSSAPDLPERAPQKEQRPAEAWAPHVVAPAPQSASTPTPDAAAPTAASPAPSTPTSAEAKAPPPASSSESAGAAATPPGSLTLLNGPRSASPKVPAPIIPQSDSAAARIETSAVQAPGRIGGQPTAPPVPGETTIAQTSPPPAASELPASEPPPPASEPPTGVAMPELTSGAMLAAMAATALALTGLAVLGYRRWRLRAPAPPVERDIADISFGGASGGSLLALERAPAAPDGPAPHMPERAATGATDLPVPTTYAEALEVLGASPEASTSAIKKIVDGLRQSWHPDHARSEADRLHREARVRQINVAWDLVSQRRSAA